MSTVTIFAGRDDLTADLSDEIVALGSSAHIVTVAAGWVGSATRAVILLDSVAGRSAIEGLSALDAPRMQIVILGRQPPTGDAAAWCTSCEDRHHHLIFIELDRTDGGQPAHVAESVLDAA